MVKKAPGDSTAWTSKLGLTREEARSGFVGNPDDLVILFMGPTGAGKSTFIREYTGNASVSASHTLQSTASRLKGWVTTVPPEFQGLLNNRRLILVDTPGFDDSFLDDSEILRQVSAWLALCYNDAMAVAGIVYMNDISQKRMFGSTRMSLNMLMKLCGDDSLNRVVLATSQWDSLANEAQGKERQSELQTNFWQSAETLGASIRAIRQKPQDQQAIVNHVLETYFNIQSSNAVVFGIQKEIVDLKMSLPATAAGRELKSTLEELLRLHKEKRRGDDEKDLKQKIALLKGQINTMRLPIADKIKDFLRLLEMRLLAGEESDASKQVRFEGRSRDIVIAIVGCAGAGKTMLIQQFTKEAVAEEGLSGGTSQISPYDVTKPGTMKAFKLLKPRRLILLDTPGIDPTGATSEQVVLSGVQSWLTENYKAKASLAGVLYLHDISNNRKLPMDALQYQRLLGQQHLSQMIIASSRREYLSNLPRDVNVRKTKEAELDKKEEVLKADVNTLTRNGAAFSVFGKDSTVHTSGGNDGWQDPVQRDQAAALYDLVERFLRSESRAGLGRSID